KGALDVDLQRIPAYQTVETTGLGPDSFVDRGILGLARLLAFQPFTVVFIETNDGGIRLEAANLFRQGLLIGCPNYVGEFVKKMKSKLDSSWEVFRPGVERYFENEHKWTAESYRITKIDLIGEAPSTSQQNRRKSR